MIKSLAENANKNCKIVFTGCLLHAVYDTVIIISGDHRVKLKANHIMLSAGLKPSSIYLGSTFSQHSTAPPWDCEWEHLIGGQEL